MAKTTDLPPNPDNPRRVDDKRLLMLRKSLLEFGDLSGITFNRRTGQLVTGHQRVTVWNHRVAGEIRYDRRHDTPTATGTVAVGRILVDGEEFAYREVDWPATVEKAGNVAANRNAGEFDLPMVADIMKELQELEVDLDLTMFDEGERGALPDSSDYGELPEPSSRLDEKAKVACPACGHEFATP